MISILVVSLLIVLIFIGAPIFVALGVAGLVGVFALKGIAGFYAAFAAVHAQVDNFILVAVPLYILMGEVLSISGIGRDLFDMFSRWTYRLPGGLAIGSIAACTVFGAMSGLSIAGVATIGLMAVPEMLRRGYDRELAVGSVTAAGALAMLIPPSLPFVLYGGIGHVSVGKLFIGGIVPGVILAMMMAIYVAIRASFRPDLAPPEFAHLTWKERLRPLKKLWAPVFLIILVLGTIYTGIATPTESAAMGAVGAFLVAGAGYRALNRETLKSIMFGTTRITGALMLIVACAMIFGTFMDLVRLPETIARWCISVPLPPLAVIFMIMLFLIILGCFVDGATMTIVTTPILLPAVLALGYDPVWYGIIFVLNLEMAVITPPVGLNLYTMKSLFEEISMEEIIRGTLPYVAVELVCMSLFILVPQLALWLPNTMR